MNEIRPLPHAEGSEKFILSSFMKSRELMELHPLDLEAFYLPAHRTIYREIAATKDFDVSLFVQSLHDKGLLDDVGGPSALADIYTYAVGHQFDKHLSRLRDRHARRMAIRACNAGAEAAFDCSEEDNFLRAISDPITAVHEAAAGTKPTVTTKAVVLECISDFEERVRGKVEVIGLATHSEIDQRLKGLHRGRFWVIGGYPAGGKTLLAGQVAVGIVQQDAPALFITLEMAEREVMNRCIVQASHVPAAAFYDPKGYAKEHGNEGPVKGHLNHRKSQSTFTSKWI